MSGLISGFNGCEVEAMKYWTFASSYKGDKKAETKNMIFSGDYLAALKVDGYYQRIVKDDEGNCFMIARNRNVKGEIVNKIEWVPHLNKYFESLPNGTCLLAEIYLPGKEGSKNITSLLGCLKEKCIARQEAGQKLHLYVFDVMAYNGENYDKTPAKERFKKVRELSTLFKSEFVEYAVYYEGLELWNKIQEYLADGREGVVLMKKSAPVYFKRTPARMSLKIKKELQETVDVVVMGSNPPTREYKGKDIENWSYWEDAVTKERFNEKLYKKYSDGSTLEPVTKSYFNNWAGSLVIGAKKDNKVCQVGSLSGLTEEVLCNWKDYIGKVCEITAMEVMDEGLRHPKFVRWRPDLTARDTDYYRIFGEK